MKLLFVGDGPRDEAVIPQLTNKILGRDFAQEFSAWARLGSGGRGYDRKLRYAVRQSIDRGLDGVVAVVDADRDRRHERVDRLSDAREQDRVQGINVPTAVGEAIPHLEAWLLDDPAAVRKTLNLDSDVTIPNVRRTKSPKDAVNEIIAAAKIGIGGIEALREIASHVVPQRYLHSDSTGFAAFAGDCRRELCNVV